MSGRPTASTVLGMEPEFPIECAERRPYEPHRTVGMATGAPAGDDIEMASQREQRHRAATGSYRRNVRGEGRKAEEARSALAKRFTGEPRSDPYDFIDGTDLR